MSLFTSTQQVPDKTTGTYGKVLRYALPTEVAKAVVNSFVVTRVDYCNALLAGAGVYKLDRLQMVLNTAARLIYGLGKYDHIQHVLRDRQHGAAAS